VHKFHPELNRQMENTKACKHIECNENAHPSVPYCSFHYKGGVIADGETYEQYQVIEQDFINFIKIIPINDEDNLKVYSPVLRDIIIRCCVQIEIFFKEWAKFECSEDESSDLFKLYNVLDKKNGNLKGAKNWNFRDYFYLKDKYLKLRPIHVRELNMDLEPFKSWSTKENIPEWWNVYNSIKHDGIKSKKRVNLEITLESLAALFTLHCANRHSKEYLQQFSSISIENNGRLLKFKFGQITSPLDTKKYLFKDIYTSSGRVIEIEKSKKLNGLFS
jgi:hypothetical protein